MLLESGRGPLAQSGDQVLARLSGSLRAHTAPETHAAVIEPGVQLVFFSHLFE